MSITDKLKTHAPWVFFKEDAPNIATTADKISGIIVSGEKDENGKFKLDTLKVPICQVCPCGTAKKYCYFLYESKCHTEVNPDTNTTTTVWSTPVLVSNTGVCGNLTEAEQTWYWYEYGTVRKYVKAQKLTADGVYEDAQCSTDKACELSEDLIAACDRPAFTECCGELPIKAPIQELPHTFTPVTVTNLDGTSRTFQKKVYTDIAKENKISLISYYEGQSHRTYAAATDEQWITWTAEFARVEGKLILRTEYIGKDSQGNNMYKDIELNWDAPDTSDPSLELSTYTESGVTLYRMVKKLMPTQKVYLFLYTDEAAGANAEWDKTAAAWEKDPDADLEYYTAEYGVQLEKSEWCIEYGFLTFEAGCTTVTHSGLPPKYAEVGDRGYLDADSMEFSPKEAYPAFFTVDTASEVTATADIGTEEVPDGEIEINGSLAFDFNLVNSGTLIQGTVGSTGWYVASTPGTIKIQCTGCRLLSIPSSGSCCNITGDVKSANVTRVSSKYPDEGYARGVIARQEDNISGDAVIENATITIYKEYGLRKKLSAESVKITFSDIQIPWQEYGDSVGSVWDLLKLPYVCDAERSVGDFDHSEIPTTPTSITCLDDNITLYGDPFISYTYVPAPYNSPQITWSGSSSGWIQKGKYSTTGAWRPANVFKDKEALYVTRIKASVNYPAWYAAGGVTPITYDATETPAMPGDPGWPADKPPIFCCTPRVIKRVVMPAHAARISEIDYGLLGPYKGCPNHPYRWVTYIENTGSVSSTCKKEMYDGKYAYMTWYDEDGGQDVSKQISKCYEGGGGPCAGEQASAEMFLDHYGRLSYTVSAYPYYDYDDGVATDVFVRVWFQSPYVYADSACTPLVYELHVGCYTGTSRQSECSYWSGDPAIQWPSCNDSNIEDPDGEDNVTPQAFLAINNLPEDLK